jgi:hypothetical protein
MGKTNNWSDKDNDPSQWDVDDDERIRLGRRNFLFGSAAVLASAGLVYNYRMEIGSVFSEELSTALKIKKLVEEAKVILDEIKDVQDDFQISTLDVLQNPDGYETKVNVVIEKVNELIEIVKKVEETEFKVNSAVTYRYQKKVQGVIARFSSGKFALACQGAGIYMKGVQYYNGAVGKANSAIDEVNSVVKGAISSFGLGGIGHVLTDVAKIDKLKTSNGNFKYEGVEIRVGSLASLVSRVQKLVAVLGKLIDTMKLISDKDIEEYSNNKYVNKKMESPRKKFCQDVAEYVPYYLEIERSKPNAKKEDDNVSFIQRFLVEYGFLVSMGDKDPVDGKYGSQTISANKSFAGALIAADKWKEQYEKRQEKGEEKIIVAESDMVRNLQEILAVAGYLDIDDIDSKFGSASYHAYARFSDDVEKIMKGN